MQIIEKSRTVACIPAYNEEKYIGRIVLATKKHVDRVIVCDDASSDMTAEIAAACGAEVIRHDRNMGYGAALASLFKRAQSIKADAMVTLDGDGQHNPDDVPRVMEFLGRGDADIVIGTRFFDGGQSNIPSYRKIGIKAISKLSSSFDRSGVTDSQSGLRAYTRRALDLVRPTEMGMGASTQILSKASEAGLRVKEIPINVLYDEDSSTHNPLVQGVDVILSSVKYLSIKHPLMFYGGPGLASLLVALFFTWWSISLFVETRRLITNVALIAVASGLVGLILMAVAIILWVLISVVREK